MEGQRERERKKEVIVDRVMKTVQHLCWNALINQPQSHFCNDDLSHPQCPLVQQTNNIISNVPQVGLWAL